PPQLEPEVALRDRFESVDRIRDDVLERAANLLGIREHERRRLRLVDLDAHASRLEPGREERPALRDELPQAALDEARAGETDELRELVHETPQAVDLLEDRPRLFLERAVELSRPDRAHTPQVLNGETDRRAGVL